MEQYQIRLDENLTVENLFDKLSLRSWTMIQKDLNPHRLTLPTYLKLSKSIRENLECHIEAYDACGKTCFCNETALSKPLSRDWELDSIDPKDKIYQLYVAPAFDEFIEEVAKDLTNTLKDEISFGHREKVQIILTTVIKCVLSDHIFWNSLCRVSNRAVCQPSCCSLML